MLPWLKRHRYAVLAVLAMLGIVPGYLWPYSLSGASAAPTILVRDTVIVNRAAYDLRLPYCRIGVRIASPRRGDIVLARLPDVPRPAFKRVIGLPGETIEVRENRVLIDGRPLPVQPLSASDFTWVPPAHRMGSTVVMEDGHWAAYTPGANPDRNSAPRRLAPGEYFLMGDNRDNSLDSRAFGPVDRDSIVGKSIAVLRTGPRVRGPG